MHPNHTGNGGGGLQVPEQHSCSHRLVSPAEAFTPNNGSLVDSATASCGAASVMFVNIVVTDCVGASQGSCCIIDLAYPVGCKAR